MLATEKALTFFLGALQPPRTESEKCNITRAVTEKKTGKTSGKKNNKRNRGVQLFLVIKMKMILNIYTLARSEQGVAQTLKGRKCL